MTPHSKKFLSDPLNAKLFAFVVDMVQYSPRVNKYNGIECDEETAIDIIEGIRSILDGDGKRANDLCSFDKFSHFDFNFSDGIHRTYDPVKGFVVDIKEG